MTFFRPREFLVSQGHPEALEGLLLNRGQLQVIELGVDSILDPLRRDLGVPVYIVSGYRTKKLNQLVGGSTSSDHMKACAADITCGVGAHRLYRRALKLHLPYRQLIYYPQNGFVHVSWNIPGVPYKHEAWVQRRA